jgi:hypothetical protein
VDNTTGLRRIGTDGSYRRNREVRLALSTNSRDMIGQLG